MLNHEDVCVCVCVLRKKLVMNINGFVDSQRRKAESALQSGDDRESQGGCPCGLGLDE